MIYYEDLLWSSAIVQLVIKITKDNQATPVYKYTEYAPVPGDTVISRKPFGIQGVNEVNFDTVLGVPNTEPNKVNGIINRLAELGGVSWVNDFVNTPDYLLSSLYNAYGTSMWHKIDYSSRPITQKVNQDIVISYVQRIKSYQVSMKEVPLVNGRYRVIRHSTLVRFLQYQDEQDEVTTISINHRESNSYLRVSGYDIDDTLEKFTDLKTYHNIDVGYVMLPDGLTDVSIDVVKNMLAG